MHRSSSKAWQRQSKGGLSILMHKLSPSLDIYTTSTLKQPVVSRNTVGRLAEAHGPADMLVWQVRLLRHLPLQEHALPTEPHARASADWETSVVSQPWLPAFWRKQTEAHKVPKTHFFFGQLQDVGPLPHRNRHTHWRMEERQARTGRCRWCRGRGCRPPCGSRWSSRRTSWAAATPRTTACGALRTAAAPTSRSGTCHRPPLRQHTSYTLHAVHSAQQGRQSCK